MSPGYEQYQMQLLEVPWPRGDYGDASSDDLSSEWDSDAPDSKPSGFFGGFKVKGGDLRCLVFSKTRLSCCKQFGICHCGVSAAIFLYLNCELRG